MPLVSRATAANLTTTKAQKWLRLTSVLLGVYAIAIHVAPAWYIQVIPNLAGSGDKYIFFIGLWIVCNTSSAGSETYFYGAEGSETDFWYMILFFRIIALMVSCMCVIIAVMYWNQQGFECKAHGFAKLYRALTRFHQLLIVLAILNCFLPAFSHVATGSTSPGVSRIPFLLVFLSIIILVWHAAMHSALNIAAFLDIAAKRQTEIVSTSAASETVVSTARISPTPASIINPIGSTPCMISSTMPSTSVTEGIHSAPDTVIPNQHVNVNDQTDMLTTQPVYNEVVANAQYGSTLYNFNQEDTRTTPSYDYPSYPGGTVQEQSTQNSDGFPPSYFI